MLQFCAKYYWKFLTCLCIIALAWQLYSIIVERIEPSNRATEITEKKLGDWEEFPILFKICPDPAFNTAASREGGYDSIFEYFTGESRFDETIFGWAGHTNASTDNDTVEVFYQKIINFPDPNLFVEE